MTLEQASERAKLLRNVLEYHNRLYYEHAAPVISDYKYDQFFAELVAIEREWPELVVPQSPTQRVGALRND